jgi:hypothetical protein
MKWDNGIIEYILVITRTSVDLLYTSSFWRTHSHPRQPHSHPRPPHSHSGGILRYDINTPDQQERNRNCQTTTK